MVRELRRFVSSTGFAATAQFLWHKKIRRSSDTFVVKPRPLAHPIRLRRHSTDVYVYRHIFVEREYALLDRQVVTGLMIDCGANVGYASAYLLSTHPKAHVIAIEPDAGNFTLLEENLRPYGSRAQCLKAGVWHRSAGLVIKSEPFRDGGEWARQVREANENEVPDVHAVGLEDLLKASGYQRISILKMDIEGAEVAVLSGDVTGWLSKTDAIAIELHDDAGFGSASAAFARAMAGHPFRISTVADMTMCLREPARTDVP